MNIVIVGSGTVGSAICKQLISDGHNITVVDTNSDSLAELANVCDVSCLEGNGAEVAVLRRAGAQDASLLIAVTPEDELNILCCAAAKKLGTEHTIARVRNPEYSELIHLMKSELNLSMTINPELAAAKEIYRSLRFPSAAKIDTFCRGRVELAEFVVPKDSMLCGLSLNEIRSKLNIKFLVCAVLRKDSLYIPSGDFVINADDILSVTSQSSDITKIFKLIGMYKDPIKNILIVGGGRTTYYLEEFLRETKIQSTVIEKDKKLCLDLAEDFKCSVVCDSGTNHERLLEDGIDKADAFLALSSSDEENAVVSMYAKTKNVSKIITMISAVSYIDFFKSAGLESIISPKSITAAQILHYVRSLANKSGAEIESLHKFMNGRALALEFIVKDEIEGLTNIPLKSLKSRKDVLIACIVRKNEMIIPTGSDEIRLGDTVIVVSGSDLIKNIGDILA